MQDRIRVAPDTREVTLTIHYRDDLDPTTFQVQPDWARHCFSPEPGTQETVHLPLKKARNRFFLEAYPVKQTPPLGGPDAPRPPAHAPKDRDEFEFRVESADNSP